MLDPIQVIDFANLFTAIAALILSTASLWIARKLEGRSISSAFVLDKYFEIVKKTSEDFSNIQKNDETRVFMDFARWIEPYKEILYASGLESDYDNVRSAYFKIMSNKKNIQAMYESAIKSGTKPEEAMRNIAEEMGHQISPDELISNVIKLDKSLREKIGHIISDPINRLGKS